MHQNLEDRLVDQDQDLVLDLDLDHVQDLAHVHVQDLVLDQGHVLDQDHLYMAELLIYSEADHLEDGDCQEEDNLWHHYYQTLITIYTI